MPDHDDSRYLLDTYSGKIRPFLAEHAPGDLLPLDQAAELLTGALNRSDTVTIGFVGEAQVGKSTLINALLKRKTLPSGGIGPLTAQATRVSYSAQSAMSVIYHGRNQVNRLVFAIAAYLQRRGEIATGLSVQAGPDASVDDLLIDAEMNEASGVSTSAQRSEKGDYMLGQAKRILLDGNSCVGNGAPSNAEILVALRAIVQAEEKKDGVAPCDCLVNRIAEVRDLLGKTEEISETQLPSPSAFKRAIRDRATGWRSPLIRQLHVRLAEESLQGMTLVDLPGVGVLNDPAGKEAEHFVRTEGDALVVVLRNSGMTNVVADLLERSGVITKLLFGGEGNTAAIDLILAVTHLDDVAKERYQVLKEEAEENGETAPERSAVFRDLAAEMDTKLRAMLADALHQSNAFHDLSEDQRTARERAVSVLCRQMAVISVAAPDYLGLLDDRGDFDGFFRRVDDTGVPELSKYIKDLARASSTRRVDAIVQFDNSLRGAVRERLSALVNMYQEGRGVAIQDWERFRDGLTTAAEPLRREMTAYHGETVGILREGIESEIRILCKDAELAGTRKVTRLTREGRSIHYKSLLAALTRNGVWERRSIDYPDAITRAMVDSIATDWGPKIIEAVRAQVKSLSNRDAELVERLCEKARELAGNLAVDSAIEAQRKVLQGASRTAVAWTKEQLESLRQTVRQNLREAVEKPIEKACESAIRRGHQHGSGAKDRILDAFEEGGNEAVVEARKAAERILRDEYKSLLRRLDEGFLRENGDPVQAALEMLTGQQVEKARSADSERKAMILSAADEIETLLAAAAATKTESDGAESWRFAHA